MKVKEVLKLINVRRETLSRLVRQGRIRTAETPSGRYEYNEEDVLKYAGKKRENLKVIYARVSTQKQKPDLENQVARLESFCAASGHKIDRVFQDVAGGINFDKRKSFSDLLDLVLDYKIQTVFITCKDRLSRAGFGFFRHLFEKFGCRIEVINEAGNEKLDSEEIFEEIITLIHCFSMRHYSRRKLKAVLNEKDCENENQGTDKETV
jgi:predicted site-specific integrase-resolvase